MRAACHNVPAGFPGPGLRGPAQPGPDRAYLISLCVGTAIFGLFFFLTIFVQNVWGYSPLKTGIAFLPLVAVIMAATGIASPLVNRIGARPQIIAGSASTAGGMFWLSRISEHSVRTRRERPD